MEQVVIALRKAEEATNKEVEAVWESGGGEYLVVIYTIHYQRTKFDSLIFTKAVTNCKSFAKIYRNTILYLHLYDII